MVLNSTQRNNLAHRTAVALHKDGFRVTRVADDAAAYGGHGLLPGVAEIRYPPGSLAAATLLSYYFPGAHVTTAPSSSPRLMVSLGAKYRAVAGPAAVRKAIARSHATLSRTLPASSAPATHASATTVATASPSASPSC